LIVVYFEEGVFIVAIVGVLYNHSVAPPDGAKHQGARTSASIAGAVIARICVIISAASDGSIIPIAWHHPRTGRSSPLYTVATVGPIDGESLRIASRTGSETSVETEHHHQKPSQNIIHFQVYF